MQFLLKGEARVRMKIVKIVLFGARSCVICLLMERKMFDEAFFFSKMRSNSCAILIGSPLPFFIKSHECVLDFLYYRVLILISRSNNSINTKYYVNTQYTDIQLLLKILNYLIIQVLIFRKNENIILQPFNI